MSIKKLIYSKCPNCKEHTLPGPNKGAKSPDKLVCRNCGKSYKMNPALLIIINLFSAFSGGLIVCLIKEIAVFSLFVGFMLFCVIKGVVSYFAPLEEVDE